MVHPCQDPNVPHHPHWPTTQQGPKGLCPLVESSVPETVENKTETVEGDNPFTVPVASWEGSTAPCAAATLPLLTDVGTLIHIVISTVGTLTHSKQQPWAHSSTVKFLITVGTLIYSILANT